MRSAFKYLLLVPVLIGIFSACDDDEDKIYSPKPRGYFRIDFPEKNYRIFDSICPYTFEMPVYSRIVQDKHKGAEPCWLNLEFPQFKATIHLSYKAITSDTTLNRFLEDSRDFAVRHQIKATGLEESVVIRDSAKVYGLMWYR